MYVLAHCYFYLIWFMRGSIYCDVLAYPNPARDKVSFALEEPDVDKVVIHIYSLAGERVSRIEQLSPGQAIDWQVHDISPGIYLAQVMITKNGQTKTLKIKKIAIVK